MSILKVVTGIGKVETFIDQGEMYGMRFKTMPIRRKVIVATKISIITEYR